MLRLISLNFRILLGVLIMRVISFGTLVTENQRVVKEPRAYLAKKYMMEVHRKKSYLMSKVDSLVIVVLWEKGIPMHQLES